MLWYLIPVASDRVCYQFAVNRRVMMRTLIRRRGNRLRGDLRLGRRPARRPHAPRMGCFRSRSRVVKKEGRRKEEGAKEGGRKGGKERVLFWNHLGNGVCFRPRSRSAFFLVSLSFLFMLFSHPIFLFLWVIFTSLSAAGLWSVKR